jgi:hypothetical protein
VQILQGSVSPRRDGQPDDGKRNQLIWVVHVDTETGCPAAFPGGIDRAGGRRGIGRCSTAGTQLVVLGGGVRVVHDVGGRADDQGSSDGQPRGDVSISGEGEGAGEANLVAGQLGVSDERVLATQDRWVVIAGRGQLTRATLAGEQIP